LHFLTLVMYATCITILYEEILNYRLVGHWTGPSDLRCC
jgi:hypothetical protein